jgi:GxxExxY protein
VIAAKERKEHKKENNMQDIMKLCDMVRETAYAIHVYHGHGHLEKVYENALAHRLKKAGVQVEQQYPLSVYDEDGTVVGEYFADLLVDGRLIVELKASRAIAEEHVAQILGYLRSARREHGLLINFGSPKFEIKKYVFSEQKTPITSKISSLLFPFASFVFFRG